MHRTVLDKVIDITERNDPDPDHASQVAKLAVVLFDGLQKLHRFCTHERDLLRIAAFLHDIGWARTMTSKHHKHSYDMIMESVIPGLPEPDRAVCALVARFHRKAEPDPDRHKPFAALPQKKRNIVEWLAGILRVADGLDRSHFNCVQNITCRISRDEVTLCLETKTRCDTEVWGAERKAQLLERKLGKKLVFKVC
ncbi:MAG: HD domain-containing protein [bacterium]|nr:MAG: HD domain-containing protein [bacterium]